MVAQPSHAPKYGPIAQLGAHAVLKQSGVIYHAPPSGFWGLKYGLVAQLGERSVRIRKVEGSTPFESTNLIAGRTPEVTIVVLPYGFVLATQIKDRL